MNDWKAKQAAKASAAAAMQAAFPHLVAVGGKVGSLNAAAKNIRVELKAAFPSIKFSVKSSRYSGGDSISVHWIDGPSSDQVNEIIGKYSGGSFNGMEDIYEYSDDSWNDAFGEAKYVSAARHNSDKAIESAIRSACLKWAIEGGAPSVADFRAGKCWNHPCSANFDLQSLIHQVASKRVWCLPAKAKKVNMEEVEA